MKTQAAFQNGRFLPAAQLAISVNDAGFVWGATVTDRLRTFDGKLFRVEDHLRRFRESCRQAQIPLAIADDVLTDVSQRLVKHNRAGDELSVIWLATPGEVTGADARTPTIIAYTQPLRAASQVRLLRDGAHLITSRASVAVRPQIKHRSRLAWWIARREVRAVDAHAEPLFIDPATDHLLETPAANILVAFETMLVSPPAGSVLEGVSLKVVEELCEQHQIAYQRRHVRRGELANASEVLLANTTYCVAGVSRIDDRVIPFPGPMLARLRELWSGLVGVDLAREIGDGS